MFAGNSVPLKGKTSFSEGKVELTFSNIVGSIIGLDAEEEGGEEEEEGEEGLEEGLEEGEVLIWLVVVVVVVAVVIIMLVGVGWISLHRHTQHVKFKSEVLDKAINWDLLKPSHFE